MDSNAVHEQDSSPKRRKLTKKERTLLYMEANGKCQICGEKLPEIWHGDHIKPFYMSRKTNVHEMQATCPQCNLKKGKKW